jgi:multimeric flavodoxin WrbA
VGSPRPRGNTSPLVDVVLGELARQGIRVGKVMLGERRVAGCLGHDDCAERRVCPLAAARRLAADPAEALLSGA